MKHLYQWLCDILMCTASFMFFTNGLEAQGICSTFDLNNDNSGSIILVWQDTPSNTQIPVILAATKPPGSGSSFSSSIPISNPEIVSVCPILQVAPNGTAVALWLTNSSTTSYLTLMANTYLNGGWSTPFPLSDSSQEQVMNNSYAVTLDEFGNMVAMWTAVLQDNSQAIRTANGVLGATNGVNGSPWNAPTTLSTL